jgi:hypothetical protein
VSSRREAAEIHSMQRKSRDPQVRCRYSASEYVHGRVARPELNRRLSVNPRMSTKQKSDMDRRASFSILYPTT